ncbi:hypothetical protein [Streptomyces sp. NPDC047014]|uniref:hypothetical protein n=1 Tax=Streptomyces sp. NPDC047014 TaxID=3155736 RepID=UPI0033CE13C8
MNSTGDERIGVVALGTLRARGTVEAVAGGRLLVRTPEELAVYEREDFLAGRTGGALHALRTEEHERAVPLPDGGFVVAGTASVRALDPDGGPRWEHAHDPWHGTGRAQSPAVSPDGRLVSLVVPAIERDRSKAALVYDLEPERSYTWDELLLLDAASGEVTGRQRLRSLTSGTVQYWRSDGGAVGVSCWTAWNSWSTWWAEPGAEGFRLLGSTWMHAMAGFLADGRALTQRFAEHVFPADDRDELAVFDPVSGERVALLDLAELAVDPENDEFSSAEIVDGRHLVLPGQVYPSTGPPEHRHWLLAAEGLRPLGRLDYPRAVGPDVTPLGDGTWLTEDDGLLHRWSPADRGA